MFCVCGSGLPSFHMANCKNYLRKVINILPINEFGSNGVANSIDITGLPTPVPESVFISMFNSPESTQRLHLIKGVKNFESTPGEQIVQTWADNTVTKLSDGQLVVTFIVPETSPLLQSALEALECGTPFTYLQTVTNQLIGYADPKTVGTDKKLYPIPVERWMVMNNPFTSDTAVAQTMITIYLPIGMDLSYLQVLDADEHGLKLSKNYEAKEATLALTAAVQATTLTVRVSQFGGILGSTPITGLDTTAFIVKNGATTVTVLTATETPAGVYALTYASQTTGDTLDVSLSPTSGYVANAVSDIV